MKRTYIEKIISMVVVVVLLLFATVTIADAAIRKPGTAFEQYGKQVAREAISQATKPATKSTVKVDKPTTKGEVQNGKLIVAKKAKKLDDLDVYSIESETIINYLAEIQVAHNDRFWLLSDSREEIKSATKNIENAKIKVSTKPIESVEQLPKGVFDVMSQPFGRKTVYMVEIQIKDPNHKTWLQQNAGRIVGGIATIGIGLL